MTETWGIVLKFLDKHGIAAMVTVVAVAGSTPREAGARLVVGREGTFFGTIGGGALEWQALSLAQAALARGAGARPERRSLALGPQLGQCCGGRVDLLIEVFDARQIDEVRAFAGLETSNAPFWTITAAGSGDSAAGCLTRRLAQADERPGRDRLVVRDDGALIERHGRTLHPLHLFGAGHVGKALMLALAPLPFAVTWIDERLDLFPRAVPGNFRLRAVRDPAALIDAAPAGAFVLVLTHSHALDLDIVHRALRRGDLAYVGVIGSATKRARFEKRLSEAGLPEEVVTSFVCPIGLGTIQSKEPAAIAASVAADLLVRLETVARRHDGQTSAADLQHIEGRRLGTS